MNSENIEIEDLEYFYRYVRMFSYCNAELSIDPQFQNQIEQLLEESIEESEYLIHTDDLDDIMSLNAISEYVAPFLKQDNITQYKYVTDTDIKTIVTQVSIKMCSNLYKDLEDSGYVQLAWDANTENFVYMFKDKC